MDTPLLLTPGPLTTAAQTRAALTSDWGSRSPAFIALTERVRGKLLRIAEGGSTTTCIPIQGSGSFAVEAMLGSFVPRDGHCLVAVNGAYGRRMVDMLERMERRWSQVEADETSPLHPPAVEEALASDPSITSVAIVHVETTTGCCNPVADIADIVEASGRELLVDAMSSFGALPTPIDAWRATAIAASSNKCLEGVPGLGFVIAQRDAIRPGSAPSLCLDLAAQEASFAANGQWRFTPPVQVLAGLDTALDLLDEENGPDARLARYQLNCRTLMDGMRDLGYRSILDDRHQAPIIITYWQPDGMDFERFYRHLEEHGFSIYPGKLTRSSSFSRAATSRTMSSTNLGLS